MHIHRNNIQAGSIFAFRMIIISNVTVPLVGAVDVAMMGRIDDPAFIGGVGLGMMY